MREKIKLNDIALPHHQSYGSRIRRFGWSKQTQMNIMNIWSAWPWGTQRYQHFSNCCIIPVRTRSLTAITIYPNHSAGHRSGLHRGESSTPNSISVRHPVLLCYSASAEPLPSEAPSPDTPL